MAAIKAPWDEFPELWGQAASKPMFDEVRKNQTLQAQQVYAQRAQLELEQEVKQQAIRDAIASVSKGKGFDEALPGIKDVMMQYGDLNSALKLDEHETNASRKGQLEDSSQLSSIREIAKYNPELAQQLWDTWGLSSKYGATDFSTFQKDPEIHGSLKDGLWTGSNGQVNILREPAPDKTHEPKFSPMQWQDAQGNYHEVNKNDEDAVRQAESLGWHRAVKPDPFAEFLKNGAGAGTAPAAQKPPPPPPIKGESYEAYKARVQNSTLGM